MYLTDLVFNKHENISICSSAMRLKYRCGNRGIGYHISVELDSCNLRRVPDNSITLYEEDTAQVEKSSDIGTATIMFAFAVARGRDPQPINLNFRLMSRRVDPML